ncbi:MAG TPA: glycosyltransferase family 39 protein [Chitinophagaceae bacterium]|nr:glycosyltransferase family 39 protein [Chitinophagaceae bacterium]
MKQQSLQSEYKWIHFLIGLAVLVNFSGLFVPLMDPDAGVYASLSKNMVLRNNYLELYFQGNDWLDKPHFPFWITALFFEIFGIHTWSYKLPGILFVLLGAYYTYLFAKRLYNKTIALWAVFILLTAEHIIISNNDVRAEPFLTGLIIASIYHFSQSLNKKIGWHLVAASLFAACAVMTKGPFTLIPVGGAIAGELIIKRNWRAFFHWRWLVAFVLIALFIVPELYSLWYQFDKHPEKAVFGKTNVSGIRFFLWDSQFGRFLNTAPMKGKGDPFFFVHTLLWAFLPWSLIMYASLIDKIRSGTKKINYKQQEWFTLCGSLLTLLVFSLSKFQLPYYANIIFPLLAILTAQYIWLIQNTSSRLFKIFQYGIIAILIIGGILLQFFYSPAMPSLLLLVIIAGVVFLMIAIQSWLKLSGNLTAFYRTGLSAIALNLYLNWFFYPDLLKYQSSSEAAFYMNKELPEVQGIHSGVYAPVFEFYISDPQFKADTIVFRKPESFKPGTWYVSNDELDMIKQRGMQYEIIKELDEFHVTMLTAKFINKKTRSGELKKFYLIKII